MTLLPAVTEFSEFLSPHLKVLGLLALFVLAVCFLSRKPQHQSPTDSTNPGAAHAAREAKPPDPQRVEAIYNILCSNDRQDRKTKGKQEYSIGIITALEEEFRATIAMLDEEHNKPSDFQQPHEDSNNYVWGRIAQHNAVIVSFPSGIYGTSIAARVATLLVSSFPSIRLGFMVGIGGGVPSSGYDVRLGDIVVSQPGQGTAGGVVQYDLGKEEQGKFRRTGSLNKPPSALLSALTSFRARPRMFELCETIHHASMAIYQAFEFDKAAPTYAYQGSEKDRLFQTTSAWTGFPWQSARPVERRKRPRPEAPTIHYGLVASGNRVMKNGRERDRIVAILKRETNGGQCLCFEMEAAGLMDNFPCLVIRGISDYADSHKGHSWHGYAAMTAAAFTRELLHVLKPTEVESSTKAWEVMSQVRQDVQEIKADVSTLSNVAAVKKIKEWLVPSDHSKNFEDAQEARYSKTNAWFLEHNTYQSWLSGDFDCIWLHGPSGCGKTVLSSTMVDALLKNGICLYFFFDFRDEKKQTLRELLLSLVCQLYSMPNGPRETLHRLYSSRNWNQTKPSTGSLVSAFDNMLEHSGQVQLVLDALDESKKGKEREELLQWLHRQIKRTGSKRCKLRIIMTSRSEQQDIIDALGLLIPEKAKISIEQNASKVKDDIRKYIERRISNDRMFARWRNQAYDYQVEVRFQLEEEFVPEESCSENEVDPEKLHACEDIDFDTLADDTEWDPILRKARGVLIEKASTMFRWASLQLDSLGSLGSSAKIEEALADLPEGLDDIYARSLREIPKRHRDDAVRILETILASRRVLSVDAVLELTSVDLKASPGHSINPAKRMRDLTPFSSIMSVLIKRRPTQFERTSDYIEIAHSSVRDYLLSGTPELSLKVGFSEISSRASLLRACLAYWGSIKPHYAGRHKSFSVGQYVCYEWQAHARDEDVGKEAYEDILKCLLHSGSLGFRDRRIWYCTGPPLYSASRLGLSSIVKGLLERGINPNESGGKAGVITAMRTTSYYKKKLVEFQVEPEETIGRLNDKSSYGPTESALMSACFAGHQSIVRMLLDYGAEAHVGEHSLLHTTCPGSGDNNEESRLAIVQMLIEKGVDVNAEGGEDTYVLHAASRGGNSKIVELLLKNGADVKAKNGDHETALYVACGRGGNPDTVKVLLNYGADSNAKGGEYSTPLRRACLLGDAVPGGPADKRMESYNSIVKMLLDHGADVNDCTACTDEFGSPLMCAARHDSAEIVQSLLGKRPDIDFQHYGARTALEVAMIHDRLMVIQALIEHGANLDLLPYDHQKVLLNAKNKLLRAKKDAFQAEREHFTPIVLKRLEDLEKSKNQWAERELRERRAEKTA